jgi:hypothetical protein
VTKLNVTGSALEYSTYVGGTTGGFEIAQAVAVDAAGGTYVTGYTGAANFPTTPGAFETTFNGGTSDVFVLKFEGEGAGPPASLTLNPPAATNPVDTEHCVTATVRDAAGNPVPNVTVRFAVTGSVNTTGSAATGADGNSQFCYMGPPLPGGDAITAYADTDEDSVPDSGEPSGAATKTWTLPASTPLCEIQITNGGWIIAANGDHASFGGNARSSEDGELQGQEEYQDHGPAQPMNVHSINVLAVVCNGSAQASIYGEATINGSGAFQYRINVRDLAEPGAGHDSYWLLLQNGYSSGDQVLQGGNIQIHRQ